VISAAQRVEHYEIAAYGCLRTYAELLGNQNAVKLLDGENDLDSAARQALMAGCAA
jgi:ferritin-like metal-binding protein YciE